MRRSREEAERLVREYEQSGMTRKAFCIERGVAMHTLDYYRQRHRTQAVTPVPQLVPVELVEAGGFSPLRVELANGRRIVVEQGFDAGLLLRVVRALES
jgi:transposase-like protein